MEDDHSCVVKAFMLQKSRVHATEKSLNYIAFIFNYTRHNGYMDSRIFEVDAVGIMKYLAAGRVS